MIPISNRKWKGVVAVNREISLETIRKQLEELEDHQLTMVADYIRGLRAAADFLNRK